MVSLLVNVQRQNSRYLKRQIWRVFWGCVGLVAVLHGNGLYASPEGSSNPTIAQYDGGFITLHQLEEFAREVPLSQRIPFAHLSGSWRRQMSGELAKSIALTSQAMTMGMHLDPSYLRARDYFIMEYFAFQVLRDKLTNQMNISLDAQRQEYETFKSDFWLSSTVTLRVIRTRSADKMSSAVAAIAAGRDFAETEIEMSEVSPRYRGRVLGPFPAVEERTMIPPPDEVIAAAMATPEGQTTGPIKVGEFYFLAKTEKQTPGRQPELAEVAEKVEERLREKQSAVLVPALVDALQKELDVQVDEQLFLSVTPKDEDLLATVGAYKLYRKEFTDLNGHVRGPATRISSLLPTRLKQFVFPYMIAEWAKMHHYGDREETKRAIYYYDLQHLASRIGLAIAEQLTPPPTDADLRKIFDANINDYRVAGKPEPRFEDHRDDLLSIQMQQRSQDDQRKVAQAVLAKLNFKMLPAESSNITALEALTKAGNKIPADARLLEIGPARIVADESGATPYTEIGRAPAWRITYASGGGGVSETIVEGPAPLLQSKDEYTSIGAFQKWANLWRFDTDSLKRHAVDQALGDFVAKHGNKVRVAATVEFAYSKDDPTSPTDCLIVYSATPTTEPVQDGVMMQYSAWSGEVTKRRLGEPEGKCPTCPSPDLPAKEIVRTQATTSASLAQTTPTLFAKGEN